MFAHVLLHVAGVCAVALQVLAQDPKSFTTGLVSFLNTQTTTPAPTNVSAILQQVLGDSSQSAFFASLADSSVPKTFFVPNDTAFAEPNTNSWGWDYQATNTGYLGGLLSYHLLNGTWNLPDLGTQGNHTIVPTNLQGHNMVFLENNEYQTMAFGHDSQDKFEIYNQWTGTYVVATFTYQHITIHITDHIIGIPGSFSSASQNVQVQEFVALAADVSGTPPIETSTGITVFVPWDGAMNDTQGKWAATPIKDLFLNHVIYGQTVTYHEFTTSNYTSASGHQYSFDYIPDVKDYYVTCNGVRAHIIRSDFLLDNGVMHVIDNVFYNVTPAPVTTSSSSPSSPTSTGSSNGGGSQTSQTGAPSPTNNNDVAGASKKGISGGAIAGIVIGVIGGLAIAAIVAYLLWRNSQRRNLDGIYDMPQPYNVVAPDTPATDMSQMKSPTGPAPPSTYFGPASTTLNGSQVQLPGEKAAYAPAPIVPQREDLASPSSSTALVAPSPPPPQASGSAQPQAGAVPISDEVVDQLLQRFAARIDRGHAGDDEAPPTYQ